MKAFAKSALIAIVVVVMAGGVVFAYICSTDELYTVLK